MKNHDLLQIQKLFFESFAQIWESNLGPALNELDNRLSRIESNYVTKDYLDDKLGKLKAEINPRFSRLENKSTRLTAVLHNKKVISKTEQEEINSI